MRPLCWTHPISLASYKICTCCRLLPSTSYRESQLSYKTLNGSKKIARWRRVEAVRDHVAPAAGYYYISGWWSTLIPWSLVHYLPLPCSPELERIVILHSRKEKRRDGERDFTLFLIIKILAVLLTCWMICAVPMVTSWPPPPTRNASDGIHPLSMSSTKCSIRHLDSPLISPIQVRQPFPIPHCATNSILKFCTFWCHPFHWWMDIGWLGSCSSASARRD